MIEIKAPNNTDFNSWVTVYLAGSIEEGKASPWQQQIMDYFKDTPNIVFYNPRRIVWDESINITEQIHWELRSMEDADFIVIYFDPATKSPISLLELGLHVTGTNVIVCCPDGFWRKQNVVDTCTYYGTEIVDTFDELVKHLESKL